MTRILIANLGDSPVVVAALVGALAARGTPVDQVEVLYPEVAGERWIVKGFQMLKAHLDPLLPVPLEGEGLPFADASTRADCLVYLRRLCARLERHERTGVEVYLGLSGGRKHTSALMAVPALFYSCVKELLHLHDHFEQRQGSQVTAHELQGLDERRRAQWFSPPATRFALVTLPRGRLSDPPALRRWLSGADGAQAQPPVAISAQASAFYGAIFGPDGPREVSPTGDGGRPLELIAPLGDSPMVVTQAYALLRARGYQVSRLHVVYPRRNAAIASGAQQLERVCALRGVPLAAHPVAIADLKGKEDAHVFVEGLQSAVAVSRAEALEAEPALLLSGGRKGMAALALYVAQAEAIGQLYHSTIPSPAREAAIAQAYKRAAGGLEERLAELMFLDGADLGDFTLVEVPVVPLELA